MHFLKSNQKIVVPPGLMLSTKPKIKKASQKNSHYQKPETQ